MNNISQSEINRIDDLFETYYTSGEYPAVNKDIVKKIIDVKPNDMVKYETEELQEKYIEYFKLVDSLDKNKLKEYLKTLKNADIIDNQVLEGEDSFLMSLYSNVEKKHALDIILKKDKLTHDLIKKSHELLLKGTTSANLDTANYRDNNRRFVGTYENGVRNIQFLPLHTKYIESAMNDFIDYYNTQENDINNLFTKPIRIHGIIASLQVFNDGNTRFGRLLQNVKLYKQTNQMLGTKYDNPTIYLTRSYQPYRRDYREKLAELAINPNEDNINKWLLFNLRRAGEEIFVNSDRIEKVKLLKK